MFFQNYVIFRASAQIP